MYWWICLSKMSMACAESADPVDQRQREAVFVKGQKVAFITGTQTANTGSTQQSVSFEDVGVTLRVRPNITPEKAVDLIINLNISQVDGSLSQENPPRSNLDTTSRLIINDGQSVMMGGILTQKDSLTVHKLPLLGDLPLLGGLFRHEVVDSGNAEMLIFLTPYVVDDEILTSLPADPKAFEVIETARRRMESNAESLNSIFGDITESFQENYALGTYTDGVLTRAGIALQGDACSYYV